MRVGLYGGSFNPAHEGHAHVAETAKRRLKLDKVIWLVSPQNPLKSSHETASLAERMAGAVPGATDVDPRLGVAAGEPVFRKIRIGAFSTTDLHDRLRGRGIDTLVLAGISTSGVVLSTVRDATDKDYRQVVVADACSDLDAEVHRVLIEKVFPRQAEVVSTAEAVAELGRG